TFDATQYQGAVRSAEVLFNRLMPPGQPDEHNDATLAKEARLAVVEALLAAEPHAEVLREMNFVDDEIGWHAAIRTVHDAFEVDAGPARAILDAFVARDAPGIDRAQLEAERAALTDEIASVLPAAIHD